MTNAYFYSNLAVQTTLTGSINSAVLSCLVDSSTGWPTSYPFVIALDYQGASEELVRVDNNVANTLTIVRAFGGTSAVSHSAGAVVRHVHNAVDDTDFRTHEAAVGAVHGVISDIVGTDDTQTLTNKTLTTPVLTGAQLSGGGSIAGTFTGAPTFSGGVTFSGTPSLSAGAALAGDFSGTPNFTGLPTFAAGIAVSGSSAQLTRALVTDVALRTRITGDAANRWQTLADGRQSWGDGTTAVDTNLYRNAADVLKTDDSLVVGGTLTAANLNLVAWTAWTPTWTTSTGSALPVFGNAVRNGAYVKLGHLLIASYIVTFGSTTNFGAGATTSDNWVFSMPPGLTASANFADGNQICGTGVAVASADNTMPFIVRSVAGGASLSFDMSGGKQDGNAPTNEGTMDSLTPWTWQQNNRISFFVVVETTT